MPLTATHKKLLLIPLGLGLITVSNLLGHYFLAFSILATPVLLPLIIGLVNYPLYKLNFAATIVYNFSLLVINDVLIRHYAGGIHDTEGKMWLFLFSMTAGIFSIVVMLSHAVALAIANGKSWNTALKNIGILLLSGFLAFLFYIHYNVGI